MAVRRLKAIVLALCCLGVGSGSKGKPSRIEFRHSLYSLRLPVGWDVASWTASEGKGRFTITPGKAAVGESGEFHFADQHGNYFSVYVDQASDFEADAIWKVSVRADGASIHIDAEGGMCHRSADPGYEGPCSAGNGSLEIGTLPPLEIKGHTYGFTFGNTENEKGVSVEPFRAILSGFRATG